MKNLNNYEAILIANGFSLKTKSLVSFLKGNLNIINSYKNRIISLGLVSDADAEVYAIMLTNYRLNGSFCGDLGKGALVLTDYYDFEFTKKCFSNYLSSVMPKTFNRWAKVLDELKVAQTLLAKEALTYQEPVSYDLTLAEIEALLGFKVRVIS